MSTAKLINFVKAYCLLCTLSFDKIDNTVDFLKIWQP